jgi:serine/threonine-protein kinase
LNPEYAQAHCNLGQCLRYEGRFAESLAEYRRGDELGSKSPAWQYPSKEWVRVAERLAALEGRLPAVIQGEDRPSDAGESLDFAGISSRKGRPALAAKLFAEALAADPKLAEDRGSQFRYQAACVAALAGCGEGKDEPPPDDRARAQLRGQALDWLKAELDAWAKELGADDPKARPTVRRTLQHWQAEPDLAGVRDGAALARLPEAERAGWRALWEKVVRLLKEPEKEP